MWPIEKELRPPEAPSKPRKFQKHNFETKLVKKGHPVSQLFGWVLGPKPIKVSEMRLICFIPMTILTFI